MHPVPAPELLAPLPGWFSAHGRRLPWRAGNLGLPHPDPYAVLVSEVMLQQTQVATVIPFFHRWMERFPDPSTLARAEDDDVLKLWEGLGYYRRARFLKQAARIIAERGWPEDLGTLPGLGPYTSAAGRSHRLPAPGARPGRQRLPGARPPPGPSGRPPAPRRRAARVAPPRPVGARSFQDHPGPDGAGGHPVRPAAGLSRLPPGGRLRGPPPRAARTGFRPPAARAKVRLVELWLPAIGVQGCWLLLEPAPTGLLAGLWRWPALEQAAGPEPQGPALALRAGTWQPWLQVYTHRKERVTPLAIRLAERFQAPGGVSVGPGGPSCRPFPSGSATRGSGTSWADRRKPNWPRRPPPSWSAGSWLARRGDARRLEPPGPPVPAGRSGPRASPGSPRRSR